MVAHIQANNGIASKLDLVKFEDGYLDRKAARAITRAQAAWKKKTGVTFHSAGRYGLWRPLDVQDGMHRAGAGHDAAAKRKYDLNPNSVVSIAPAGYSSHGWGDRIDIVGQAITAEFIEFLSKFGLKRDFGSADPNHFGHDGKTACAVVPPVVKKPTIYVVRSGDTLGAIARKGKVSLATIAKLNPGIKNLNNIAVGQHIRIK